MGEDAEAVTEFVGLVEETDRTLHDEEILNDLGMMAEARGCTAQIRQVT